MVGVTGYIGHEKNRHAIIAALLSDHACRRLSYEERFRRSMCGPEQKHARCTAGYVAVRDLLEEMLCQAAIASGSADSGDCGQVFRLIADSDSDRSRTAFR
jgi:hypothetical protein